MTRSPLIVPDYPAWICGECGARHGRRECNPYATWHPDECGICGQMAHVTEPRDYGHLKPGWRRQVLDPCCGSRMFWFDREDDRAVFGDIRSERHQLKDKSSTGGSRECYAKHPSVIESDALLVVGCACRPMKEK